MYLGAPWRAEVHKVRDGEPQVRDGDPAYNESPFVSYWELRCTFADKPEMIEAVTPEILPTSFRLFLDGDQAAIDRVAAIYSTDHPQVRVVNRVPKDGPPADYQPDIVTPATGASGNGPSDTSADGSVSSSSCPDGTISVTGEWIK